MMDPTKENGSDSVEETPVKDNANDGFCTGKTTNVERLKSDVNMGGDQKMNRFPESDEKSRIIPENDGDQSQKRKHRRGIIEKRRRDRINSALAELKRLIPSAFDKQGSQKLEKAEILHMAVQYLRSGTQVSLHRSSGRVPIADFHSMGFRYCASEVDEFLSRRGIQLHDPLRLRLSNHLQCFGAQRQNVIPGKPQMAPLTLTMFPLGNTRAQI